jgi:hypothetical protein
MTNEFEPWPKIARLNRNITITEKIDGTNAAVVVNEDLSVFAQSRTRIITPEEDNYGFARWVHENAEPLASLLGPGRHFGEWWGQGIQRKYGLTEKRFSLFNTHRWGFLADDDPDDPALPGLSVVPVLYVGPFDQDWISDSLDDLRNFGSKAAPGFMDPEGIIIWHDAARVLFKVTLKNDEAPKGQGKI